MFRQLRNKSKRIDESEMERILLSQKYGTLSTTNEDGYPYASPTMFCYVEGKIYLHCAVKGQKRDNLLRDPRACFCVVEEFSQEDLNAPVIYRSVIAFGKIRFVENSTDRMRIYTALCRKFNMIDKMDDPEYIRKREAVTEVLCLEVEHMTGKKL